MTLLNEKGQTKMTQMLDEINDLITHNSELGEYFKKYEKEQYLSMLRTQLDDDIYLEDLNTIVYVYSKVDANHWYQTLKFSTDKDKLAKNMLQYIDQLKIKIIIKNKKEYFKLHPKIEDIENQLDKMLDLDRINERILMYYQDEIKHYVQAQSYLFKWHEIKSQTHTVQLLKNDHEIALELLHNSSNLFDLLGNENKLDLYLIQNQLVGIKIKIETEYEIVELDTLVLK